MSTSRTTRLLLPAGIFLVSSAVAWGQPASFRGDATHSGVYASPSVPTLERMQWKFKTGGKVVSSPAVVDGVVYSGSSDRSVYALDAKDGTVKWRYKTGGAVSSSPAVVAGTVFIVSADGNLYALDAAAGKLEWKFSTAGERRFTAPGIHGATPRLVQMGQHERWPEHCYPCAVLPVCRWPDTPRR